MALAKAFARPFWTCNACRTSYVRAFTTSGINELPRQRRPWQDLAPYKADPYKDEAIGSYQPVAEDNAFPVFEDEAFAQKAGFGSLAVEGAGRKKKQSSRPIPLASPGKSFKSDGLSNHSSKTAGHDLSIPVEFLSHEEGEASHERPHRYEPQETPRKAYREETSNIEEPTEKPMSSLPWYLQGDHFQKRLGTDIDDAIAERQKMPDLPEYPPQQYEEILQYLSVECGLDYLSMLDLRKLDPPPALGNNLIMVVGTARGERHLNVSAERFCAWLRRTYKFNPYPDGFLGRNELKIKQRRKAKKARALANAGAGANSIEELDDGIHTDWICVHVGYLDPHPEAPLKSVKRYKGMVGFGEENNKVTLVVQMFTEHKRLTVGLEDLWKGILERNLKRQQHLSDALAANAEAGEERSIDAGDGEDGLTEQELKARKRFKLGNATVLDNVQDHQDSHRPTAA